MTHSSTSTRAQHRALLSPMRVSVLASAVALALCLQMPFAAHAFAGEGEEGANTLSGAPFQIQPRISITTTYSDNPARALNAIAESDWVAEIAPGIRLQRVGPRAKLYVDWQRRFNQYASESRLNNSYQLLDARFSVTPIEQLFFVDSLAAITQQNQSPFANALSSASGRGALIAGDPLRANRVETKTFQISPYVRGRIGDFARYQMRFNETEIRSDQTTIPSTRTLELVGKITNANPLARISWSGEFNLLQLRNATVERLNDNRIRGSVIYALTDQLRITGTFGRDATDFAANTRKSNNIYGAGLEWSPSVRTRVAALREHRFFGEGYVVQFSHRTPRTAWRASSTRDVTALPQRLAAVDPGSVFGVFYDLLASSIPDPLARAEAVNTRLQQTGIPPAQALGGGFLTTRPYLALTHEASIALLGVRNTLSFSYTDRKQRATGPASVRGNRLTVEEDVAQETMSASWAYRLTPLLTATVQASRLKSNGLSITRNRSQQDVQSLVFSRPLSARANVSFGVRHVELDSTVARSYRENALFAALSYRF
jgi:uncharacterized protein (PEP-CTERM system associated)